ncbi:MAG: hypothetical protein ABIR82_03710 [Nocardioides sp.]
MIAGVIAPVIAPGLAPVVVPVVDLNPLDWLGDRAKEGLADAWTAAMISLWSAGMWLMESVFEILDKFLTPDLGDPGLAKLYGATLWVSFFIAVVVAFGQIGLAVIRRDGTSLGALAAGLAQYGAVVTGWIGVCGGLVLACAGLTTGLLDLLLGVEEFSGYQTGAGWPDEVGGTVAATALGFTSLFLLLPAGFGYVLIMLVREGALLILAATMPIAAAGALGEGTKSWMWKSIRWFLAACLTAPLLALVLGLGVQITRASFPDANGTLTGTPVLDGAALSATLLAAQTMTQTVDPAADQASQVGMAVVGAVILVIGCFCPMALFRLLAFVDPGTGSGSALRSTLSANGGLKGLISPRAAEQGSGAATASAADGRAASEDTADAQTATRFQSAAAAKVGAGAGHLVGGTMNALGKVASVGAAMGLDVASQAGFGSQGYYDTSPPSRRQAGSPTQQQGPSTRTPRPKTATHGDDDHHGIDVTPPSRPPGPGGGTAGQANGPGNGLADGLVDDAALFG